MQLESIQLWRSNSLHSLCCECLCFVESPHPFKAFWGLSLKEKPTPKGYIIYQINSGVSMLQIRGFQLFFYPSPLFLFTVGVHSVPISYHLCGCGVSEAVLFSSTGLFLLNPFSPSIFVSCGPLPGSPHSHDRPECQVGAFRFAGQR